MLVPSYCFSRRRSGARFGISHAVMYTSSRVVNLGVPGTSDIATSINNAGKIIGRNIALPDSPATDACSGAALEFDDAGHVEEIQGLGADLPSAMNDKGQIVGDHCTDWPDRTVAFSYPPLSILSGQDLILMTAGITTWVLPTSINAEMLWESIRITTVCGTDFY